MSSHPLPQSSQPTPPLLLGLSTSHSLLLSQNNQPPFLNSQGRQAAPYFDFLIAYLDVTVIQVILQQLKIINSYLGYSLVVKDYKQTCYVRVELVFDVTFNLASDLDRDCFSRYFLIFLIGKKKYKQNYKMQNSTSRTELQKRRKSKDKKVNKYKEEES